MTTSESRPTGLDHSNRILKRAQYEALEFSLYNGDVLVRNESYADPENHEYHVTIHDEMPTAFECPADNTYADPCIHRVAVGIRPRLIDIAARVQLVADGGTIENGRQTETHDTSATEECECDQLSDDLPCWTYYRRGRLEPPESG